MPIVDPFDSASSSAAPPPGIVDPFETPKAGGGVLSDIGGATTKGFTKGWEHLHPTPTPPEQGAGFWSGMLTDPVKGLIGGVSRLGAPLEMAASPIAPIVGRGLAGLESYAGEAAQAGLKRFGLARPDIQPPDRQQMYEQAQADFNKAMLAAGPPRTGAMALSAPAVGADIAAAEQARAAAQAAAVKAPPTPVLSETEQARQRTVAAGMPVDLPRALSIQNPILQAGSVSLSKAPVVGTPLNEAISAVPARIGGHVETIAGQYGRELPENVVGSGIGQTLTGAAEKEAAGRQAVAATADEAAQQQFEQTQAARQQAVTDRQAQADAAATRAFGNVHPNENAENNIRAVQEAHAVNDASAQQEWNKLRDINASVPTNRFEGLHDLAENGISDAGVTLGSRTTPNALEMMAEIKRLSAKPGELPPGVPPRLMNALENEYGKGRVPPDVLDSLGFPGGTSPEAPQFRLMGKHAPEPGATEVSVQGLDELRKRIGNMAFNATSDTDRRASNAIKNVFGDWLGDTLENHLTPGSNPAARATINNAVAATRAFKERFGYNHASLGGENRTAARVLNQMATGDIGPEAVANNLVGKKPGSPPTASPLHDAILNAVDNPAGVRAGMRGAYWNAMTEGKTPDAIAKAVRDLPTTRMGRNLFEPHEHDLMQGYAGLRVQTPQQLNEIAALKPPKPTKVEPGPTEQLTQRIVGRTGSGEQVLGRLDSAMRKGGDIKEAARVWGKMSEANRNEFKGSVLRGLGGGGEDFSLAKFVKNWDAYSDQAKAFMFGRDHRQAINDFHTLAKQYQETIAKYGNPSGTAQVSAWHKLLSGGLKTGLEIATGVASIFHPIGVAIAGLGLYKISKILGTPQGARNLSRWNSLAKSYQSAPSASKLAALSNLSRTLNAAGD